MAAAKPGGPAPDPTLPPEEGTSSGESSRPAEAGPAVDPERYELGALLGQGGMGEVYEARDRRLGRSVALKFIRGADPDQVMRLLQEARAQARIDHPNVCKVYEAGEFSGRPYIAMQRVSGQRLDSAAGHMALPEKVRVMRELAGALHEAHRLGVIHRDLKPSNILASRGEDGRWRPVLMDFGLALEVHQGHGLTRSGALMGTPAYMSPEQARGDVRSIDRRSDVYSLGATLYELLTGAAPFRGATPLDTVAKVLHEEPVPPRRHVPQLPRDLETVVLKCLAKDPDRRYPSAKALEEDLGRYLDGEPILGQRPGLLYRLRLKARRHRALVALGAVSLVSVLLLAGFWARSAWRAGERARLAEGLGRQVKDVELFLRMNALLPLHDTSTGQARIHERMKQLAARPHGLGEAGDALIHHALGRAHLAMLGFEEAREALEKAAALGLDTPELHAARGQVLGALYQRALEDARRGGGPEWLKARRKELERRYLEPALEALARSRGSELEPPRYLEGLLAFYRQDYEPAAQAAEASFREAPWLYEARKLSGDVAHAQAMELLERGDYDAARAGFQRAEGFYTEAAERGRSDARIHEALAETWLQRAEADQRQGKSHREALEQALEASGRAVTAAPLRASGHTRRAYVLLSWYRFHRFQGGGQDPRPILTEAMAAATRALEQAPHDASACDTLGLAHFLRGLQEARDGADPLPSFEEARVSLTRALELQPHYPWAHNDLGMVHRWKGNYQREHGQDPRPAYEEAERAFLRAVEDDPKYLFAQANLVDIYTAMAEERLSRGLDPEEEVRKALDAGDKALGLDGRFYWSLNQVARAELARARFLLDSGGDPRPSLERALQQLERSLSINATEARTWLYKAMALHLEALRNSEAPDAARAVGRKALAQAYVHDAGCIDCHVVGARLALAEAAWAKRRGRPVLRPLQQALAEARRAVELYPYFEAHLELASVYHALAEAQPPDAALASVKVGLGQVERALGLHPDLARAHALRGSLMLTRARLTRSTRDEQDARDSLTRALELNPLLRKEYAAPLEALGQGAD